MKEYNKDAHVLEITTRNTKYFSGNERVLESKGLNREDAQKASDLLKYLRDNELNTHTLSEKDLAFLRSLNDNLRSCYIFGFRIFHFEGDVKDVTNKLI